MKTKHFIGYCMLGIFMLFFIGDTFATNFKHFGWWALITTPVSILVIMIFISFFLWLLD